MNNFPQIHGKIQQNSDVRQKSDPHGNVPRGPFF
uniref:Uncharacterized protein n=1 Tax=Anguilla anguilla TaxID=7936 RepID=A0A0E9PL46_ANGAN